MFISISFSQSDTGLSHLGRVHQSEDGIKKEETLLPLLLSRLWIEWPYRRSLVWKTVSFMKNLTSWSCPRVFSWLDDDKLAQPSQILSTKTVLLSFLYFDSGSSIFTLSKMLMSSRSPSDKFDIYK
jgi:hypothetical protein